MYNLNRTNSLKIGFLMIISLIFGGIFGGALFVGASMTSLWDLLGVHIEMGLAKEPLSPSGNQTFSDSLQVQQALKNQISYDLIASLDVATTTATRSVVLTTYVDTARKLLQTAQHFIEQEQTLIGQYARSMQDCETPIKQYNTEYSSAVQSYQYALSQQIAQKIAVLRACIAEQGVYYKVHGGFRDNLTALQTLLQKKIDYLMMHEEKIISYYDMLKPQLLQELYDLSRVLEVNYTT